MRSPTEKRLSKASLNISIPPSQREAFFQALIYLRQEEGDPLMSASAIVVRSVIQAASRFHSQSQQMEEAGQLPDGAR